jgi:hypothetical protein
MDCVVCTLDLILHRMQSKRSLQLLRSIWVKAMLDKEASFTCGEQIGQFGGINADIL